MVLPRPRVCRDYQGLNPPLDAVLCQVRAYKTPTYKALATENGPVYSPMSVLARFVSNLGFPLLIWYEYGWRRQFELLEEKVEIVEE